jgi:hypothetical protein
MYTRRDEKIFKDGELYYCGKSINDAKRKSRQLQTPTQEVNGRTETNPEYGPVRREHAKSKDKTRRMQRR